ncbi:pyridoxamine 5'-phosphate oxidase family protein [Luteibacter aegosomaticola]|uniref:pyridoxamine 5'-phosphate oxidase family protein n=1 Tax=Luteibacter aegosomaticola TaxID=2911538 RepID=UPI001FFB3DFE|nr:pyridoxamine 5'-phosphate oxidase family protein [Luteibacter aegosomaticola]UPG92115.1 pyridoxamine 5'-phosphate oxidase family protein [Luteibacter aegosomaticola]
MSRNHHFHEGERAVQRRAGEAATAARNVAMVSDSVIGGARPFVASQFMVATGSIDATGAVWASLLFGKPGFAHTEDGSQISLDVPMAYREAHEPLWTNLAANKDLGLLFIELGTRRRYRVNGTLTGKDDKHLEVSVREAYPNCPKYIQRRQLRTLEERRTATQTASGSALRGSVSALVTQADTLFLASRHAEAGADVSHRGGDEGFVQLIDERTLRIPDYPGNSMFNTWGNLQVDAHAGICIPDFTHGRLLQLTGTVSLEWDQPDPSDETGGTGRYLQFHVDRWLLHDAIPRAAWTYIDASPFNPPVPPRES